MRKEEVSSQRGQHVERGSQWGAKAGPVAKRPGLGKPIAEQVLGHGFVSVQAWEQIPTRKTALFSLYDCKQIL